MPIRIYALAKQLKLDSKELVDICTKAGITGKGSALASLTDEEYGHSEGITWPVEAEPAARPGCRLRRSGGRRRAGPRGGGCFRSRAAETLPSAVPDTSAAKFPCSGKVPESSSPKESPPKKGPAAKPAEKDKENEKAGLSIKLAPMPAMHQPSYVEAEGATPQKPDIKLPLDAIRASRAGGKPLSEHLRKHEEKKAEGEADAKRATSAATTAAAGKKAREGTPGRGGNGPPPRPAAPVVRDGKRRGRATLGGREQRQLKRKRAEDRAARRRRGRGTGGRRPPAAAEHIRRTGNANTGRPAKANVVIQLPCTVREFSEAVGVPARAVLGKLLAMGTQHQHRRRAWGGNRGAAGGRAGSGSRFPSRCGGRGKVLP